MLCDKLLVAAFCKQKRGGGNKEAAELPCAHLPVLCDELLAAALAGAQQRRRVGALARHLPQGEVGEQHGGSEVRRQRQPLRQQEQERVGERVRVSQDK